MAHGLRKHCKPEKRQFARRLRYNPTKAEEQLWSYLRLKRLGFRFRRQAVLLGYIADFYCPSAHLVIELDGAGHDLAYDRRRDEALAKAGIATVRFANHQVFYDPVVVAARIGEVAHLRAPGRKVA